MPSGVTLRPEVPLAAPGRGGPNDALPEAFWGPEEAFVEPDEAFAKPDEAF